MTRAELVAQYTTDFQAIYGADINLDPDSPDGQMMNIWIQSVLDYSDLLVQVYNGFDPDNAIGVILDQRVSINGIQRLGGTFSTTNITLVTSQACSLPGLDQETVPPFTVADNAGNNWFLLLTQNISGAGTQILQFQAAVPGAELTTPNTITIPVTIILGVTSVNNPSAQTGIGINEETDAALKIRRQQSVAIASQGYYASILAALENVPGVTSVFLYENITDSVDGNGVPGHSIWAIVAGAPADADVAQAIYAKRNAGCGMFGATTYTITQVDGTPFVIRWDKVTSQALFYKFTATSLDGVNPPNIAAILAGLPQSFAVNQEVNINQFSTLVQAIDPNTLVTNAGFSTTSGGSYTNTLTPSAKTKFFVLTSGDIIITPIILSPVTAQVKTLFTQQLTPLGGFGPYTYAMHVNNSGGSVSAGGLYTAGASTGVTDTVRVTDAQSNIGDALMTVTP